MVTSLAGPDDRAVTVVVGDHGQVAVALAVGHLVDPDAVDPVEPGVVEQVGDDVGDDAGDGLPRAAQQPGDRGFVHPLRQPPHHVLEVAGEPGVRSRPGHRLGADPPAPAAIQAADLGPQEQPRGAQIQPSPATCAPVIDGAGRPATRAGQPAGATAQVDHDPLRGERHTDHIGTGHGEHLVECGSGAHASLQGRFRLAWQLRNLRGRRVRVLQPRR